MGDEGVRIPHLLHVFSNFVPTGKAVTVVWQQSQTAGSTSVSV